jgi:hypothetical protein
VTDQPYNPTPAQIDHFVATSERVRALLDADTDLDDEQRMSALGSVLVMYGIERGMTRATLIGAFSALVEATVDLEDPLRAAMEQNEQLDTAEIGIVNADHPVHQILVTLVRALNGIEGSLHDKLSAVTNLFGILGVDSGLEQPLLLSAVKQVLDTAAATRGALDGVH